MAQLGRCSFGSFREWHSHSNLKGFMFALNAKRGNVAENRFVFCLLATASAIGFSQ